MGVDCAFGVKIGAISVGRSGLGCVSLVLASCIVTLQRLLPGRLLDNVTRGVAERAGIGELPHTPGAAERMPSVPDGLCPFWQ